MDYPVGWTCQVVELRLERYVLRALSWGDSLAMAEHLEACVSCAELLAALRPAAMQPAPHGRRRG